MAESSGNGRKKKGFFALLKESVKRSSEGCGPGCGCHEEKKRKGGESAGSGRKD